MRLYKHEIKKALAAMTAASKDRSIPHAAVAIIPDDESVSVAVTFEIPTFHIETRLHVDDNFTKPVYMCLSHLVEAVKSVTTDAVLFSIEDTSICIGNEDGSSKGKYALLPEGPRPQMVVGTKDTVFLPPGFLSRVVAASTISSDTRHSTLLTRRGDKIVAMNTDAYRLVLLEAQADSKVGDIPEDYMLRNGDLHSLKSLVNEEDFYSVGLGVEWMSAKNNVRIIGPNWMALLQTTGERAANYKAIMPEPGSMPHRLKMNTAEQKKFTKAVKGMAKVFDRTEEQQMIVLSEIDGKPTGTTRSSINEIERNAILPGQISSGGVALNLKSTFLLDGITILSLDDYELRYKDNNVLTMATGQTGDVHCTYLLMPTGQ